MARTWTRGDLVGTRNGTNKSFDIPNFASGAVAWIFFNGVNQKEITGTPEGNEYSRSGATIILAIAPEAAANLWVVLASETVVVTSELDVSVAEAPPGAAEVYVNPIRRSFYFNVEIRNKLDTLLEIIESDIENISWQYVPLGGCAEAQIVLRRSFDDYKDIDLDYDVRIYRERDILGQAGARLPAILPFFLGTAFTGARELRWSGFVRELEPVFSDDEQVILRCSGYSYQLRYIVVANDSAYVSQDVGAIVRDILDNYVLGGSQIQRTAALGLVPDTGVVIDSIQFDTSAAEAIQTLAEIAGAAEWGVRADKEFFFIQRVSEIKQTHVLASDIMLYRPIKSADNIVNRVYLRGANGFKATLTDSSGYQTGYEKERRVQVGSVSTVAAAILWGEGYFARYGPAVATQPSGSMQLGATDDWIENVGHPLGLLRVIGGPVFTKAGERLQAQLPFLLAGEYGAYTDTNFRVNGVTYRPDGDTLAIDIQLGERSNALADLFKRIEFRLNELSQTLALS